MALLVVRQCLTRMYLPITNHWRPQYVTGVEARAPSPSPAPPSDPLQQLRALAAAGVLSPGSFARAKAKVHWTVLTLQTEHITYLALHILGTSQLGFFSHDSRLGTSQT